MLVAACYTDMGMESEAISGYYNRPWEWSEIKKNAKWIVQFGSKDDYLVPFESEQQHGLSSYNLVLS